jgi:hypothetical protein
MRIYEGAPRQNYQEVLRSIGAVLDQRGMREMTLTEIDDGFIIQGLAPASGQDDAWSTPSGGSVKETFILREDDLSRFMDEGLARRQVDEAPSADAAQAADASQPSDAAAAAGFYENAMRVLGAYIDQQQPRDVFFFEQDHQFVMRLLMLTRAGLQHVLVEFTNDEIESMIAAGPEKRGT